LKVIPQVQTPDRIALPRRLVPRRQPQVVTDTLRSIRNPPPTLFNAGDLIQFEDRSGNQCWILLLEIRRDGKVDAAVYNGQPHPIDINLGDLLKLRIIRTERMHAETFETYRRALRPVLVSEVAA
jgi:hypothetical protein